MEQRKINNIVRQVIFPIMREFSPNESNFNLCDRIERFKITKVGKEVVSKITDIITIITLSIEKGELKR